MEQDRKLVRPPFDSEGNVVWTTEEKPIKKQALRWWYALIPIGLICVIGLGILLYRQANRKTPQELCRSALRDALSEAIGYREPLMKAMHIEEMAGYLREMPTDVALSFHIQNSNMTLADFGFGDPETADKLTDYRGMGLALIGTYDGDAVSLDTRFAVSALSLSVIQMRYDDGDLTIASPKFIKEALVVPLAKVPGQWKEAAAWSLLPENDRIAAQGVVESGLSYGSQLLAIGRNVRDVIVSAYPDGDSALDHLVDAITYEQLKNKDGKELTEHIVVGSEKTACYVFRINVDEKEFYDIADRIGSAIGGKTMVDAVHNAWRLEPQADGGNGLEVLAYVTKDGELAQLTAEVNGYVGEKKAHFSVKLRCMGADDPQDKLILTANGDIGGEVYELTAKKTVTADRSRVSSQFDVTLALPGMEPFGINGSATYAIGSGLFDITANTVQNGKTTGTLHLAAECTYKTSWDMRINELTFTDSKTDKFLSLYGQFYVSPSRNGVLMPEGERLQFLDMTPEDVQAVYDEALSQVNWYMRQFFR